jgi:predicted DNA-binding protein (UPF0251 family)
MPRPRKRRRISCEPEVTYFKPAGVPLRELEELDVTMDELEAVRLVDSQEKDQITASRNMGISQPTLHRLLLSARKKISDALVNGRAIRINGGNYYIKKNKGK